MIPFEFATSGRIVFGAGASGRIDSIAAEFGKRPLLVTGKRGATGTSYVIPSEPTVDMVREGADLCRAYGFDVVIAIGGGSVIDGGKAIAALASNDGDPLDYLEVVGRGQPLKNPPLPFIAVPTTAGTGSEVTRNAVLGSPQHGVKASLRSPLMLPNVAIIDPDLTLDLPPDITAATGLDALTQVIEPFISARANCFVDVFCLEGMARVARSLRRVCQEGHDRDARGDMAFAAMLGGLALANAGLGVVHGFAAPIGGMFPAPHGVICAALLPHGFAANVAACRARNPESVHRFATVARTLTGTSDEPEAAVDYLRELCADLEIPGLSEWGVTEEHIPDLVEKANGASSMKANPLPLTPDELHVVLRAAL